MPVIDIPFFGNLVICIALVAASLTMAAAVGAGRGRPHLLVSARMGAYATAAFVALAVCVLAYAFLTHDFRIRYVARYSDRSMPWQYLITSLWGGQDGSLLWWTFLLGGYTVAVVRWLRGRYLELQPWIIASLMSIFVFFLVLMLFAANPFATFAAASPVDGEGLNPLLQNYWMSIHPPALYLGFVGWSVPVSFAVAALITGRTHDEWVKAARLWTMVAWSFLSLGLLLGCLWSYEELGWGGYWAWDPVENASFMPWLVGTAYLHSAMVQERYGMLKVWNVFLILLTFWMTIFGTFLTRSGLIASVHSFAKSDIGNYFAVYLAFLALAFIGLVLWRLEALKAEHRIQALLSREFAFLVNNWMLLGMMVLVLFFTTSPLISEALKGETITVGPTTYNTWLAPLGLALLFLAGVGPLISWRKATGKKLLLAASWPAFLGVCVGVLHITLGARAGYPAYVESAEIYPTLAGRILAGIEAVLPLVSSVTCSFVAACIGQEFLRGVLVRMKKGESAPLALYRLFGRAKRRYGGYLVHLGVVLMFVGFTGAAYDEEQEAALRPGAAMEVGRYDVRYDGPRMEVDPNKRAIYTDMTVLDRDGDALGVVSPAKFIYRTAPEMPTTEVAIRSRLHEDLYVIMSTVDSSSRRGTFRVVVRPFVAWIWIGGLLGLFGSMISIWPSTRDLLARDRSRRRLSRRSASTTLAALLLSLAIASPMGAAAQEDSSSLHAGTVIMQNSEERRLFEHLLCECGDCARLPLDSCACGWAEDKRTELRARMEAGEEPAQIIESYRAQFGAAAIAIPPDEGIGRAIWAIPLGGMGFAAVVIFFTGRRWRRRAEEADDARHAARGSREGSASDPEPGSRDYDDALDEELRRLEEDA